MSEGGREPAHSQGGDGRLERLMAGAEQRMIRGAEQRIIRGAEQRLWIRTGEEYCERLYWTDGP